MVDADGSATGVVLGDQVGAGQGGDGLGRAGAAEGATVGAGLAIDQGRQGAGGDGSGLGPFIGQAGEALGRELPVMLSMTLTDRSGRNLSGQTVEAFWHSIRHVKPLSVGLNCSFGATELRPHVVALAKVADTLIQVYPNAGLPNDLGEYDEAPAMTGGLVGDWASEGLVNIVGGCCGTTPAHIAAMAAQVAKYPPRTVPTEAAAMRLSGLEAFSFAA